METMARQKANAHMGEGERVRSSQKRSPFEELAENLATITEIGCYGFVSRR